MQDDYAVDEAHLPMLPGHRTEEPRHATHFPFLTASEYTNPESTRMIRQQPSGYDELLREQRRYYWHPRPPSTDEPIS